MEIREDNETGAFKEAQNEIVIPVIEEEVIVEKRLTETGGIIISKKTGTEEKQVELQLEYENIRIEHIEVNQLMENRPEIRNEGDTIVIPVTREVLVKKILLVEEIRITKEKITENHSENVSLRKDEITITRKEK
jgi:stress response protein YsnF